METFKVSVVLSKPESESAHIFLNTVDATSPEEAFSEALKSSFPLSLLMEGYYVASHHVEKTPVAEFFANNPEEFVCFNEKTGIASFHIGRVPVELLKEIRKHL